MEFFTPEKDKKDGGGASEAGLPCALIIGDSISQGYTWLVRDLLKGKVNVDRPRTNCGDTKNGLANIDAWLGDRQWDVVHFNWGLHDLCYRHPDAEVYGNRDKVKGTIAVEPDQYRENLEKLVERMKSSAKTLIWASTTVVPPGEVGRIEGDDSIYNEIAAGIMTANGVVMNDLYSITSDFGPEMFTLPCDVHYGDEGLKIIAEQVTRAIEAAATKEKE
jgi:hypothetical protein